MKVRGSPLNEETRITAVNAERIEKIKEMWTTDISAEMLAAKIGCSRQVVLGLFERHPEKLHPCKLSRVKQVSTCAIASRRRFALEDREEFEHKETKLPESLWIPLVELESHHCRYPYKCSDGVYRFCGLHKKVGSSYCDQHDACCNISAAHLREKYKGNLR